MKKKLALDIAIEGIRHLIKNVVVDANLHDLYGANYPYAVRASKRKRALQDALEIILEMKSNEQD